MWVKSVQIKNIKGFSDSQKIEFSPRINVLIGNNNAGKSTVLRSIFQLQDFNSISNNDIRKGQTVADMEIEIDGVDSSLIPISGVKLPEKTNVSMRFFKERQNPERSITTHSQGHYDFPQIHQAEPKNFIYPYLSKRKVNVFDQQININSTISVTGDLRFLHAKINRLSNPSFPAHSEYTESCNKILGFTVTSSASTGGVQGGLIVNNFENIPLEMMGDGVPNILGLLVDLCVANNKLFIIEEPENDLHPKAIKNLIEFIIQKSKHNQFIITTHSNIVTKYLGSEPDSKLFHVTSTLVENIPTSSVHPIGNSPEERISVLEDLGYELFDVDLWQAYLILEESSSERIIRDFLIPEFFPGLNNKLKTIASQGISDVEPRFNDFRRLFVFIHTSLAYKDRAWVLVDGGKEGKDVIQRFKDTFKSWDESHFVPLSKEDFEEYYPARFNEDTSKVLIIPDKAKKRKAKEELLNQVLAWISSNKEAAKSEFKESAAEVISFLSSINKTLS
ncbi:MAG: AAA family ATPase [Deltaproteobacteria bacterium]|nr:AAA family ATPase [Deltaproteobacteria bacterium]